MTRAIPDALVVVAACRTDCLQVITGVQRCTRGRLVIARDALCCWDKLVCFCCWPRTVHVKCLMRTQWRHRRRIFRRYYSFFAFPRSGCRQVSFERYLWVTFAIHVLEKPNKRNNQYKLNVTLMPEDGEDAVIRMVAHSGHSLPSSDHSTTTLNCCCCETVNNNNKNDISLKFIRFQHCIAHDRRGYCICSCLLWR